MKNFKIPNVLALIVGIVMAIWSGTLPLHQNDLARQTTEEFVLYTALSAGGVLIALIAAFGLGRSSRRKVGESVPDLDPNSTQHSAIEALSSASAFPQRSRSH
jgi:hypothetical protein